MQDSAASLVQWIYGLAASKDGTAKFWIAGAAKTWNAYNGECTQTLFGHEWSAFSTVFSADGATVLTAIGGLAPSCTLPRLHWPEGQRIAAVFKRLAEIRKCDETGVTQRHRAKGPHARANGREPEQRAAG